MSENGSLSYQMEKALKAVFQPGHRRHQDKILGRNDVIRGINTMRCTVADTAQFARFIRCQWPEIKNLGQVTPAMAQAFIAELVLRERSGGRLGRATASLRKLDKACRKTGVFPVSAPPLLPYNAGGFHSDARPIPYTDEQAESILDFVVERDPVVARLLRTMRITGLRVTEATYLRSDNIDLETGTIMLPDNSNRTKGGRPRTFSIEPKYKPFLNELQAIGEERPDKHIFAGRLSLPDRARDLVRQACDHLDIPCLGTHAFRKNFAVRQYCLACSEGATDQEALHDASKKLGHNRGDVVGQSYIPPSERSPEG